jgi:hypothetical protein
VWIGFHSSRLPRVGAGVGDVDRSCYLEYLALLRPSWACTMRLL